MRIDESITQKGFFWRRGNDGADLPGELTVKDGGEIRLDIFSISDANPQDILEDRTLDVVHGILENSKPVTLFGCIAEKANLNFGARFVKASIRAHSILVGVHHDDLTSPNWDIVIFSTDGLDEWCAYSGIKSTPRFDPYGADIIFRRPDPIPLWSNKDFSIDIVFSGKIPGAPLFTTATVEQHAHFRVQYVAPRSMRDMTHIVNVIALFMCFATDKIASIKNVKIAGPQRRETDQDGKETSDFFEFYYGTVFHKTHPETFNWHDNLFSYSEVRDTVGAMLGLWMETYDLIQPCLGLYFSARSDSHRFINGRFLAGAQALETYHRRTSNLRQFPEDIIQALKALLVAATPEEHKEFVAKKIDFWDEPILGKRLEDMLLGFSDLFGSKKRIKKISYKITATRNYFTHYSKEAEAEAAKGRELWALCQIMEALFQLYLLKELGFSTDAIAGIAKDNSAIAGKLKHAADF
jgi:hypothetical protein